MKELKIPIVLSIIYVAIALAFVFTAFMFIVSGAGIGDKPPSLLPQQTYTAQINGVDTAINDYGDYIVFNINYARCVPLGFIDDCRWDRGNHIIKLVR